ncbi:MAG: radical SAM protein [Syntrophomonadaceae bacterium]|nr:radical SAM protein [Syntrophomonadaceae bacterium]
MYLTLYANDKGEMFESESLLMLGRIGNNWVIPEDDELIPLPKGASLVMVPYSYPVGLSFDEEIVCLEKEPFERNKPVYAVAALLPQGFTRNLMPASVKMDKSQNLPLLGYAAVGFKDNQVYVAATQTDQHRKWHPVKYNTELLPQRINKMLNQFPNNRILRQLAKCSLQYSCFTAQNIFYQRWEGGIPTMMTCNADCLGCISESHAGVESPQNRLNFKPEVSEISEIAISHLENAHEAIISFGQGCEGEPSLNANSLSKAIIEIRNNTPKGTININTNAGYTQGIKQMVDAGLDAIRVTIFSCNRSNYNKYHKPRGYDLENVIDSIKYAKDKGVTVSLNLLTFPGFTDRETEVQALIDFIKDTSVDMIQLRNLNIDPELLMNHFPDDELSMGILNFIKTIKQELPQVKIGSYSHPVR